MTTPPIPEFPRLDPASPEFWDVRFDADFMPWDQGAVPQCLSTYVARHPAPRHTLMPGCGSAYEARLLLEANWPVTAIDFSPSAVLHARKVLGPLGATVREVDFFGPELATGHFDVIYERAFLCALPLKLRAQWAESVARLLSPGGKLIGFFFFDEGTRGPPFGITRSELGGLLAGNFELVEEAAPADSIPVFDGKEMWQVWQRR
ncbi:MAG: methyltransferase [Betaproteobacteria bacterium]